MYPKILYKYREMNELNFKTLQDQNVYFSNANILNDKSEYDFYVNEKLINSRIKQYLNSISKYQRNKIVGHLKNGYLTESISNILTYAKKLYFSDKKGRKFYDHFVDFSFDILDNITSAFSNSTFNRNVNKIIDYIPWDISDNSDIDEAFQDFVLGNLLKYHRKRDYKFISEYVSTMIKNEFYKMFFVYCLSEDHKNPSMWGKYANGSNGFVIGYSTKDLLKENIVINDDTIVGDFFKKDHTVLVKIQYENNIYLDYTDYVFDYFMEIVDSLFNDNKNDIPLIKKKSIVSLFHKSDSWSHEKEFRLISNTPGLKKLVPKVLYLGKALDTYDRHRLKKLAIDMNIAFYDMEENAYKSNYDIKFINCETKVLE